MTMEPDSEPVIRDQEGELIATIHGPSLKLRLARAGLVMSAPALVDAVLGALDVLRVLARSGDDEINLAAQDMLPCWNRPWMPPTCSARPTRLAGSGHDAVASRTALHGTGVPRRLAQPASGFQVQASRR